MKKIVSLMLVFLMLFSMVPANVIMAEETGISAKISFIAPKDGDATIFVATYGINDKFLKAELQETVAVTEGQQVEYTTPEIEVGEAFTLKVFAWDSLDTMVPLCAPVVVTLKTTEVTLTLKDCDEAGETTYITGS